MPKYRRERCESQPKFTWKKLINRRFNYQLRINIEMGQLKTKWVLAMLTDITWSHSSTVIWCFSMSVQEYFSSNNYLFFFNHPQCFTVLMLDQLDSLNYVPEQLELLRSEMKCSAEELQREQVENVNSMRWKGRP